MNGGWLEYDGSNYLVPNFDTISDCDQKNAQFSDSAGMRYKCLGPYFAKAEEESPDSPYIKKVNQQYNGQDIFKTGDYGWANLAAMWDSDSVWNPEGYSGDGSFKIFNDQTSSSTGNSSTGGIKWICKYESECKRYTKVGFCSQRLLKTMNSVVAKVPSTSFSRAEHRVQENARHILK